MSFQVQKRPDVSNDWSDIPSTKEAKKVERKRRGEKRKEKNRKKKKGLSQQNKRK